MQAAFQALWRDERGAITTVEAIGYTVLIGGLVALVGFGLTALYRGKAGNLFNAVKETKAMSGNIDETSGYSYTSTEDTATGIQIGATGQ